MLPRYVPLARSHTYIRRSPLRQRAKLKPPSVLHPNKRYPLNPFAYRVLKGKVFDRSGGFCEAAINTTLRCMAPINFWTFQPHHILRRGKGGQDTMDNMLAVCAPCHKRLDGGELQWTRKEA